MKPRFEWNPDKADRNLRKHGIIFEEAGTVFDDPLFITVLDEEHSVDEERYITLGLSGTGRLLLIAHTDRQGTIRIISARKTTKRERRFYEESK